MNDMKKKSDGGDDEIMVNEESSFQEAAKRRTKKKKQPEKTFYDHRAHAQEINDDDDDDDDDNGSVELNLVQAKEDQQNIQVARFIIIVTLLIMAFALAEIVFTSTFNRQEQHFWNAYHEKANSLKEIFLQNLQTTVLNCQSLSTQWSSTTTHDVNWPFVTFPDFGVQTRGPLQLSRASNIALNPLVTQQHRAQWEAYAAEMLLLRGGHDDVDEQARERQELGVDYYTPHRTMDQGIYQFVNGTAFTALSDDDILFPIWQTVPSPLTLTTLQQQNASSNNNSVVVVGTLFNQRSTLARQDALNLLMIGRNTTISTFHFRNFNGTDLAYYSQPRSSVYCPIFQQSAAGLLVGGGGASLPRHESVGDWGNSHLLRQESLLQSSSGNGTTAVSDWGEDLVMQETSYSARPSSSLVGAVSMEFLWGTILTSPSVQTWPAPLVAVVKNDCNKIENGEFYRFAYHVTGTSADFLGIGDGASQSLDEYYDVIQSSFYDFEHLMKEVDSSNNNKTDEYYSKDQQPPPRPRRCNYRLKVYATDEFRLAYVTGAPDLYRGVVLGIFVFMAVIFAIHGYLLEKKSEHAVQAAQRSDAIVRSLFPRKVRDRLYENAIAQQANAQANGGVAAAPPPAAAASSLLLVEAPRSKLRMLVHGSGGTGKQQETTTSSSSSQAMVQRLSSSSKLRTTSFAIKYTGPSTSSRINSNTSSSKQNVAVNNNGKNMNTSTNSSSAKRRKKKQLGMVGEPIADLFQNATILLADIAGFTAWSSEREPSQVFTLLETIFRAMDKAAKRLNVFKVETVGDCYVAAAGVPDPQDDHAVIMARFARHCVVSFNTHIKKMVALLGPGTAELSLRTGMHSGPVTAGVLRGQKARFQLFGDTMNHASRMEAHSLTNKVHVSEECARLLIQAGKEHWIVPRKELVHIRGKGDLQTYWLRLVDKHGKERRQQEQGPSVPARRSRGGDKQAPPNRGLAPEESLTFADRYNLDSSTTRVLFGRQSSISAGNSSRQTTKNAKASKKAIAENRAIRKIWAGQSSFLEDSLGAIQIDEKMGRLIDWNTDVLLSLLKRVVATAKATGRAEQRLKPALERTLKQKGGSVLQEVQMVIALPEYDEEVIAKVMAASEKQDLPPIVKKELRDYVAAIATGYRPNSFHNFEHASHVILSANKLLKRILVAEEIHETDEGITTAALHTHTHGIATDPITQFAIVFSALIHDVGHKGVPNGRLAIEEPDIALKYQNKCLAEQRSVDIAWDLLLLPHFENLRACIYRDRSEGRRFRALLVNSVMATDIFDKELKAQRESRWQRAFYNDNSSSAAFGPANKSGAEQPSSEDSLKEDKNRKATIIIEHVIQASDVAHTMQHWHVYVKWNERLFQEMYLAWLNDRSAKDPSQGWYEGELWFFDNYVIPLAGKLRECGVFGVSSDEYLNYAEQNRSEWARKGKAVVQEMIAAAKRHEAQKSRMLDLDQSSSDDDDVEASERELEDSRLVITSNSSHG